MLKQMEKHPLGRILTRIVRSTNEAAVQSQQNAGSRRNINPSTVDILEIAELFANSNLLETMRDDMAHQQLCSMGRHVAELEDKIKDLEKEDLDSLKGKIQEIELHHAEQAAKTSQMESEQSRTMQKVKEELLKSPELANPVYSNPVFQVAITAPSVFPDMPKIKDGKDLVDAYKLFPKAGSKFSGEKGTGMGVMEFLEMMNEIQSFLKLTEQEFKQRLLASTTGKAHELLSHWIEQGRPVPQLYHSLMLQFDRGDSTMAANQKLRNFKAYKNKTSAEIEANIQQLGVRACRLIPKGDARTCLFDNMCANAYIEALPHESSIFVRTKFFDLAKHLRRQPTFTELSHELDSHRTTLDMDISKNGVNPSKKEKEEYDKNKGKGKGKYVNVVKLDDKQENKKPWPKNGQKWEKNGKRNPKDNYKQGDKRDNQDKKKPFKKNDGQHSKKRDGDHRGKQHGKQSTEQPNRQGKKWCSLCGLSNHTASDGCFMIRDPATGRIVECTPCHGDCTRCEMGLKHPEEYCPYANIVMAMRAMG